MTSCSTEPSLITTDQSGPVESNRSSGAYVPIVCNVCIGRAFSSIPQSEETPVYPERSGEVRCTTSRVFQGQSYMYGYREISLFAADMCNRCLESVPSEELSDCYRLMRLGYRPYEMDCISIVPVRRMNNNIIYRVSCHGHIVYALGNFNMNVTHYYNGREWIWISHREMTYLYNFPCDFHQYPDSNDTDDSADSDDTDSDDTDSDDANDANDVNELDVGDCVSLIFSEFRALRAEHYVHYSEYNGYRYGDNGDWQRTMSDDEDRELTDCDTTIYSGDSDSDTDSDSDSDRYDDY